MNEYQDDAANILIDIFEQHAATDERAAALEGLGHLGGAMAKAYLRKLLLEDWKAAPSLLQVAIVAFGRAHRAS